MENKKIFFSYSRNDASEFALGLAEELRTVNADVWIDQLDIQGGEKWDLEIQKALKASTCVLFIVSAQSVNSDNVLDEVHYALNNKKQVIPIIICDCEIPYRFGRLQQIDFIGNHKAGLRKLLKALNLNQQPGNFKTEDSRKESGQPNDYAPKEINQQKNIEDINDIEAINPKKYIRKNKFTLTGYDYDIYISWSPLDNAHTSDQENGWVQKFYAHFQVLLSQRTGVDNIKIWWNSDKPYNSLSLGKADEDAIKGAAIMLCLVSPAYLKSNYCRRELETFSQKAKNEPLGLVLGNRCRLLQMLLYNISYTQWPPELNNTAGFPFSDAAEYPGDLGKPIDPVGPKFREEISDLTDAIIKLINEFPR